MFSQQELKKLDKINASEKLIESKMGQRAIKEGFEDAKQLNI